MSWYGTKEAGRKAKASRSGARRRAREKAARTDVRRLTLDEVYEKWRLHGCAICKLRVDRVDASIEHGVPLSKGGADDETNQFLAHRSCNSKKGSRTGPRKKGLRRRMWKREPKSKIPEGADVF